jgi:glycosyltransferase involved in cell wall biosynthesis
MTRQLPYMSIVLCVYNGANVVSRAIESLLAQDYPRHRFEIIVVDDGSTDKTADVVSKYPVRLVKHERNMGIAPGRNSGLAAARGEVLVCFDDDCLVDPGWLRALARGYELPNVAGVASSLVYVTAGRGLAQRFMGAVGSGNAPRAHTVRHTALARLLGYVGDQFGSIRDGASHQPFAAHEIYGASSSFPIEVLKAVGGWDAGLHWMEDTDICRRIKQKFPEKTFWVMPEAQLVLDDLDRGLGEFVTRPWIRGPFNWQIYRQLGVTPPVFPFPLLWVAAGLLALPFGPVVALAIVVMVPQLLYAWWPTRAVVRRDAWSFLFPYLQLAEELSTVAGLAKGWYKTRTGATS